MKYSTKSDGVFFVSEEEGLMKIKREGDFRALCARNRQSLTWLLEICYELPVRGPAYCRKIIRRKRIDVKQKKHARGAEESESGVYIQTETTV